MCKIILQVVAVIVLLWGCSFCQRSTKNRGNKNVDPLQQLLETFPVLKGVQEKNVCQGISHYSTPTYTCCDGKTYAVGISFDANFKSCFTAPPKNEKTFQDAIWRLYTCLVKKITPDEKNLSLFAEKMSNNLPTEMKSTIKKRILNQEMSVDADKQISQIRLIYHHVEREVCEKVNPGKQADLSLSCDDGIAIMRENTHGRGDCCKKEIVPMALELFRRPTTLSIKKCTKTLMYTLPQEPIYYMDYDYEESDAQQLCQTACVLKELGMLADVSLKPNIPMNSEYEPEAEFIFDPENAMNQLTTLFSNATKDIDSFKEELVFDDPYNFTKKVINETYDLVEHIQLSEFWDNVTRYEIEPTLIQC
ncbi:unnamed protein product, partial [Allacma fusca]